MTSLSCWAGNAHPRHLSLDQRTVLSLRSGRNGHRIQTTGPGIAGFIRIHSLGVAAAPRVRVSGSAGQRVTPIP